MYPTRYHRPADLAEAAALFAAAEDARYLAGGQTLIPTMKQRLAAPSDLIDIARLDALKGIARDGDTLTIGAATTHSEIAGARQVAEAVPALAALAAAIGDPAVRHLGTIGGSLANNDPAADYPAAVLALEGTVHTTGRAIAAEDYFTGLFSTALADGEIVTSIALPVPMKAAYRRFPNPASGYPMAGVFVAVMAHATVRVAVTGASERGVFRAEAMEAALAARFDPAAVEQVEVSADGLLADIHGSAAYRANLVKVMAKRAVAAL